MNKLKLFSVIAMLTFSFISCEKTALNSSSGLQQQPATKSATAAIVTKSMTEIDLSIPGYLEYNACNGNYITIIQGIWRIDQTIIINGTRLTIQLHSNVSNYKLVDQTTGIFYTGSYVSNDVLNMNYIIGQPGERTATIMISLTTPGKDNNGKYLLDFHVTVNANGVITVDFTNIRSECR
jgi:hypothetical protein